MAEGRVMPTRYGENPYDLFKGHPFTKCPNCFSARPERRAEDGANVVCRNCGHVEAISGYNARPDIVASLEEAK